VRQTYRLTYLLLDWIAGVLKKFALLPLSVLGHRLVSEQFFVNHCGFADVGTSDRS